MADINVVVLIGRLTRDAELKYTNSGTAVCKLSIAVNTRKKQGDEWIDEANFFDIVFWGKGGEALKPYLNKGKLIAVEGELRQNRWEHEGQSRSKVEINANNIRLLGGGSGSSQGQNENQNGPGNYEMKNRSSSMGYSSGKESVSSDEFNDDIPF